MKNIICFVLAFICLSGCTLKIRDRHVPPESTLIETLPVVVIGDKRPDDVETYIVLYPEGVEIPFTATVKGELFNSTKIITSTVKLTSDVYVYKDSWVSKDRETWSRHSTLFDYTLLSGMPEDGGFLSMSLIVNNKNDFVKNRGKVNE